MIDRLVGCVVRGTRHRTAWAQHGSKRVVFNVFVFRYVLFTLDVVLLTISFSRPKRRVSHVDQLTARCDPHPSERDRHAPNTDERPHHELFYTGTSCLVLCFYGDTHTSSVPQLKDLHTRIAHLEVALEDTQGKKRDVEKEQEDLLVLLDEMSTKRRRDKVRMREAGLEVSEDEGEGEDDDDDDEEEEE